MCDDLVNLINLIYCYYTRYSEEWKKLKDPTFNLKRKLIRDIEFDNYLYNFIIEYRMFLEKHSINFMLETAKIPNVEIRIKHINSIDYKINNYKTALKHEYGAIPIIKSLNDIMGVRIILNESISYKEVVDYIKNHYPSCKVIKAERTGGYIAIHIYYHSSNFSFPWELQIWDKQHAISNKISHSLYKQEYTSWENENILK